MKKLKLNNLFAELRATFRKSPIEMLLAVYLFAIAAILNADSDFSDRLIPVFAVFPFTFMAAFLLNRLTTKKVFRVFYFLTPLTVLPVWSKSLIDGWMETSLFWVALVILAAIFLSYQLIVDNKRFVGYICRAFNAFFITGVVTSIVYGFFIAIYLSVAYIFFNYQGHSEVPEYAALFVYIVGGILGVLTLLRTGGQKEEFGIAGIFESIMNFIVTPALLIYTAILYVYFLKIAILWDLPKGGIAYMVFAFAIIAVISKALQPLLRKNIYGWFYDRFHLFSLPVLAMFWVGVCERISAYGLTPPRIALLLCGLSMSVFVLMFFTRKYSRYLYAMCFVVVLLLPFAVIPSMEMTRIADNYQVDRVLELTRKLNLTDEAGKLILERRPESDTVFKNNYRRLYDNWRGLNSKSRDRVIAALSQSDTVLYNRIGDLWLQVVPDLAPASIRDYIVRDDSRSSMSSIAYIYLYEEDMKEAIPVEDYSKVYLYVNSKITEDSIVLKNANIALNRNDFIDTQLKKINYSDPADFDEVFFEARKQEFLTYITPEYKLFVSHISLKFDKQTNKIVIDYFEARAVFVK